MALVQLSGTNLIKNYLNG